MNSEEQLLKTKNMVLKPLGLKLAGNARLHIGENNVIHPAVRLWSAGGDIRLGSCNILEEKVCLYNRSETAPLVLGDYNLLKVGSRVFSAELGSCNELGVNAAVEDCRLGSGNLLGADCRVQSDAAPLERKSVSLYWPPADRAAFDEKAHRHATLITIKKTNEALKRALARAAEKTRPAAARKA